MICVPRGTLAAPWIDRGSRRSVLGVFGQVTAKCLYTCASVHHTQTHMRVYTHGTHADEEIRIIRARLAGAK